MTITEFVASVDGAEIEALKTICAKTKDITVEDVNTYRTFIIDKAATQLGEDQIAEPFRYIIASTGGLRAMDLKALIGEEFDEEVFEQFNNCLGFPLLTYRQLPSGVLLYDMAPAMRFELLKMVGESNHKSCASDIGYYLLTKCEAGDWVRDTQTMHLLLDGAEAAAAAEYLSEVQGEALRLAVMTFGQALKDGPDYVKECVWDMTRATGEKVNQTKILTLMLNDAVAIVGVPELQRSIIERLHETITRMVEGGEREYATLLGIAKLRLSQNARIQRNEQEAQQFFVAALNSLLPIVLERVTVLNLDQYWLALKICQEMAQPKAMNVLFVEIVKLERAMLEKGDDNTKVSLTERILGQYIDMSKVYRAMPPQIQEQFTDYSEETIGLLTAYLQDVRPVGSDDSDWQMATRLAGYYQVLGELYNNTGAHDKSYDALTEAQILQMRSLAQLQRRDGMGKMSPDQLITRLSLSVTNHAIAAHYRRMNKGQHDLNVILTSNLDLAFDCFKAYPHDGRVVHFIINAALELGDYLHQGKGYLAECGTYEKVLRELHAIQNMRLDQQLCQDVAMIHTKAGQIEADKQIRRYKDAVRNLELAYRLWSNLAENTKQEEFRKNAEAVATLLKQIKS